MRYEICRPNEDINLTSSELLFTVLASEQGLHDLISGAYIPLAHAFSYHLYWAVLVNRCTGLVHQSGGHPTQPSHS